MTKQQLKESMKKFRSHIEPEMEEKLKWNKIETENKIKRSLKLVKSINQNREANLKKKTELTHLIEEIGKEYQSIYDLYGNLTGAVRRMAGRKDGGSSSSCSSSSPSPSHSDSECYLSPVEQTEGLIGMEKGKHQKVRENHDNHIPETSDSEDILKDKLTSTSEIKKAPSEEAFLSLNEVPESAGLFIKDVEIQEETLAADMRQELLDECSELKERLREREEEILLILKKLQDSGNEKLAEISALESEVTSLKLELETLSASKKASEEQLECKSKEVDRMRQENSGLQDRILEQENRFEEKENKLRSFLKDKKSLQQELEFLIQKKSELESELDKKSQELSECVLEIENLRHKLPSNALDEEEIESEKVGSKEKVEELELEISSLSNQKKELENLMISMESEAYHLRVENEKLCRRIFVLETAGKEKEDKLSALKEKLESQENEMSSQIKSLNSELQNLQQEFGNLRDEKNGLQNQLKLERQVSSKNLTHKEKRNLELTHKIADQEKSLTGLETVVNKLNEDYKQVQGQLGDAKSNYHLAERKVEEMAEEFFKQCEDKFRILSRRIRVAEQLHAENEEWYGKTKDRYEQQNNELKERIEKNEIWLANMKEMSLTADNTLSSLDTAALKFEGCTANFLNRISKVSCELKFSKDWIMRKNKAMAHAREDLNCLLVQMDRKEAEILLYREKVWKSENKVRELEKAANEKEEGMLALKEEKREAIRQLCVWIDYHRSHSDYYKKVLSDMNIANKKQR